MAEATVRCRKCRHLILKTSEHPVTNGHGEQIDSDSPAIQGKCTTLEDKSLLYLSEESLPEFIHNAVTEASWVKGKLKCPQCSARLGSFNFVNRTVCVCGEASVPSVHILHSKVDYLPVGGHIKQPISLPHSSPTRVGSLPEKAISAEPQIQDTVSGELEDGRQSWDSLREVNQGLLLMEDVRPLDKNPVVTSASSQLDSDMVSSGYGESDSISAVDNPLNNVTTLNSNVDSDSVLTNICRPSSNTTSCNSQNDDSVISYQLDDITTSSSQLDDDATAPSIDIDITSTQLYSAATTDNLHSTTPSTIPQLKNATTVTSQQNTTTTVNSQLRSNSPLNDYELLIKTEESQQQNQQHRRQRRKAKEQRDLEVVDSEMKSLRENGHQQLSSESQEDEQEQPLIGLENIKQQQSSRFEVLETLEVEENSVSESKAVPADVAIPDHLICPVCLDIYYSPFEVKPCGHIFCEPCLRRLAKPKPTETRCPLCREMIGMCQLNRDYIEEVKTKLGDQHRERHSEVRKYHDFTSPLPWIPGYHYLPKKHEPRQGVINRLLVHFGLNPLPTPWSIIIEGFMLYLFGVGLAALCHQGKIHNTAASGADGLPTL